jgi:hypothetical protein
MPKMAIDFQAIQEAEARLRQLVTDHPELTDPSRQMALADWLSGLDGEEPAKKKGGRPRLYHSDAERPVHLSVKLPPDLARRLEKYAWQHRRSLSELVREGIEMRLAAQPDPRWQTAQEQEAYYDNTVLQKLATPTHFLDDSIPFDDDHLSVSAPATSAVSDISHDNNTVLQGETSVQETAPTFDAEVFYLGDLCPDAPERHQYGTSGKSVRSRDDNVCRGCAIAAKQALQRTRASTTGRKRQARRQATAP